MGRKSTSSDCDDTNPIAIIIFLLLFVGYIVYVLPRLFFWFYQPLQHKSGIAKFFGTTGILLIILIPIALIPCASYNNYIPLLLMFATGSILYFVSILTRDNEYTLTESLNIANNSINCSDINILENNDPAAVSLITPATLLPYNTYVLYSSDRLSAAQQNPKLSWKLNTSFLYHDSSKLPDWATTLEGNARGIFLTEKIPSLHYRKILEDMSRVTKETISSLYTKLANGKPITFCFPDSDEIKWQVLVDHFNKFEIALKKVNPIQFPRLPQSILTELLQTGYCIIEHYINKHQGQFHCYRCQHSWHSSTEGLPDKCPQCKSALWGRRIIYICKHCRNQWYSDDIVCAIGSTPKICPCCNLSDWFGA